MFRSFNKKFQRSELHWLHAKNIAITDVLISFFMLIIGTSKHLRTAEVIITFHRSYQYWYCYLQTSIVVFQNFLSPDYLSFCKITSWPPCQGSSSACQGSSSACRKSNTTHWKHPAELGNMPYVNGIHPRYLVLMLSWKYTEEVLTFGSFLSILIKWFISYTDWLVQSFHTIKILSAILCSWFCIDITIAWHEK